MDGKTHEVFGVFSGGGFTLYRTRHLKPEDRAFEVLGGLAGGFLGGKAPDSVHVDPASLGPNHRRFGHSLVVLGMGIRITDAVVTAWEGFCRQKADEIAARLASDASLTGFDRLLLVVMECACRFAAGLLGGFIAGYVSHLVLDATTARSLPFLGIDFREGSSPLAVRGNGSLPNITPTVGRARRRSVGRISRRVVKVAPAVTFA